MPTPADSPAASSFSGDRRSFLPASLKVFLIVAAGTGGAVCSAMQVKAAWVFRRFPKCFRRLVMLMKSSTVYCELAR